MLDLYSTRFPHRVVALVWFGLVLVVGSQILFLFFYFSSQLLHRPGDIFVHIEERGRRRRRAKRGGGREKKRRAQECAQFFKLDNPSVRTWFDTCFFIYSFLFYFGLQFLFFSLSAHTDREREKKVRKPGPDHAYTRTRKSC